MNPKGRKRNMNPSHCYCFSGIITIYFSFLIHTLASPMPHFCGHEQRDTLLEFIDEFRNGESFPSMWNKSSDCCFWDGVKCDDEFGQVISLDLYGISLNNSLKTNSSLFRLQSLRQLSLNNCHLQGAIPSSLGNLSHLTLLDLSYNSLVGKIPASIGNLNQLRNLSLWANNLIGEIPSSLGNLSRLLDLQLQGNHLVGEVPASIGNLKELRVMMVGYNNLSGYIPSSFANLTNLFSFSIPSNSFTSSSTFPYDMSGFHKLEYFFASENSFRGPFPKSLFSIPSLLRVDLGENEFTGPIEFVNTSSSKLLDIRLVSNRFDGPIAISISKFVNLGKLELSHNNFNGPIPSFVSKLVQLNWLYLNDNNFSGPIPRSISKLANLEYIDFSYNNLEGVIPGFLWRLAGLTLSHNFFSSFENPSQETLIQRIALDSNSLQGPFPYWICKLKQLNVLDLSNNLFNGSIPPCLRNLTATLTDLHLSNNSFSGILPDIFANATELRSLDVSRNELEGSFPKSLRNCKALRLVNVESNRISDKFPSWLGFLPLLQVLSLRSNKFYGALNHRQVSTSFKSLRIIDISHNDLNGTLPPHYFSNWREMATLTDETYEYMEFPMNYSYVFQSMEMVHKGVYTSFERIRQDFRAVDFSGNRFYGKIPESICFLKELRLLNLSGNSFTSNIPRFLANLTKLEALDLSRNKLSGQIPEGLGKLSFLSYMNFSHNLLQGPVPQGTQFERQNCSSFMDNPRLSGLRHICGENHVLNHTPSQPPEEFSEGEEQMFNWTAGAIAYGPGVFCGLVIGYIFTPHNIHEWFTEKFGRKKHRVTTRAREAHHLMQSL